MGFFNIHSVAKLRKNRRGPLGMIFLEKGPTMPKKLERGPNVLFGSLMSTAETRRADYAPFLSCLDVLFL